MGIWKTAPGVCIGIIFAAVVISGWKHFQAEAKLRAEIEADEVIRRLSPEEIIGRCGKPESDKIEPIGNTGAANRTLEYLLASIQFYRRNASDGWAFILAEDGRGNLISPDRDLPHNLFCLEERP